ncbi:sensor histidine kinase [Nocardiopsis ganjiahuensis]|uniref:sensor histidine kinase n=1 Tax=Nocardiopsis ganjiahuensis TaxID=239984 RepID=UPI00034C40FA|nr:sensor histidine kinase [Nocardiopsis ganjiahuensis]
MFHSTGLPAALSRLFTSVGGSPREPARLVALGLTGAMLVLWLLDLRTALRIPSIPEWPGPPSSPMDLAGCVSGALCVVFVALAVRPSAGPWATLAAGTAVPVSVMVVSALLWPLPKGLFGFPTTMAETAGLLVLLALAGLRCRAWQVAAVSVLALAAFSSDYLREPTGLYLSSWLLMVVAGLAPGLYLRWRRADQEARVERVRAAERLAIARDLHDVVAHEVTGIVVQAQALRHIAERDPAAVQEALPEIEAAGTRALESMRGMVARLREPDEAPLAPGPAEGLDALAAPAGPGRPEVTVHVAGPVADLPPEVGTAVLRIVQESVTNALRYARGATRVSVVVTAEEDEVGIRVVDDGRGTGLSVGGGHGLTGMTERARLLGGDLTAGPDRMGQGWTVRGTIPAQRGGDGRG